MKVLICSDSHTRLNYFQEVMELEKPELVIFAGDHSTDALDISLVYEEIPFKIVRGNTDFSDRKTEDELKFEINGKKVLLTHGHLQWVKSSLNELEIIPIILNDKLRLFTYITIGDNKLAVESIYDYKEGVFKIA